MPFLPRARSLSIAAVCAAALALAGCASPAADAEPDAPDTTVESAAALLPTSIADAGKLTIAAAAYAPAVIAPTGGATAPTGWDAELAAAVAGVLGLEPEFVMIPFDGIISGLLADRYDMAVGDIGINPDRLESVSFVKNHYAFDVFVSNAEADEPEAFDDATDICGRHVGVLLGSQEANYLASAAEECSSAGEAELTVSTFQDQATVNLALAQGRIDMNLTDDGSAALMLEESPDQFAISFAAFVPVLPTGFAFPNNDDAEDLTAAVTAAVDHLIESGEYGEIMDTWSVGEEGRVAQAQTYSLVIDDARAEVETTREED